MKKNDNNLSVLNLLVRMFGFVKPFISMMVLLIILNAIFSTLSTLSIAIIKLVFSILFPNSSSTVTATTGIPKAKSFLDNIYKQFFENLSNFLKVPNDTVSTILHLSILIIIIFLLKNLFKYWSSVLNARFEEGIVKHIRDIVFNKLTSLSVDFYSKNREGNLISVITNDIAVLNSNTISAFNIILRESIQVIIFLLLLITISPYLTMIALLATLLSLFIIRFSLKFLRRYASRMQATMADYTSLLQETIFGIRVIKAFNAEKSMNDSFANQTLKYLKSSVKHQKILTIIPSVNEIFAVIALCVIFFVGGSEVLSGQMKADDLMLFLFSLFSIMSPVSTVLNSVSQFQRGVAAGERVFQIIDQEPSVPTGKLLLNGFENEIVINDISFGYDDDTKVLKNASFKIDKTKKIAFVGASGSGKSTMLDLLIRFYDPKSGSITIDGINIKDLKLDSYRSLFGIVSQETLLFNDTVANNIRFGDSAISDEQIIGASKISNAYNFIMKLPDGFNTMIGDRGIKLSGGERQRIAIARALVRNPYIIMFDEATSALDSESEKIVQEAINESLKRRTAIIVAHRLATIVNCDEILVFEKGVIVERGTHQELLAMKGAYKNLYNIQFGVKD